ncbi:hypothetical protein CSB45_14675 [candidate division KSB3 bacterium]|uniref:YvcK family protein n=1 Tax=candidate division KSB3 bacterium TaxID=2044937 RepID=A0A2G6E1W5_9BACT|nr:MAG: hypothetical protein CSB45_14675 [candidate division KSB3 bacterium]
MTKTELTDIAQNRFSLFDLLPQPDIREKLAGLVLNGTPAGIKGEAARQLRLFRNQLSETSCNGVKVVVFGGGSGLSNIIGGDSRRPGWQKHPFEGLKRFFPQTKSVVCITDNGGSTGEILKDLDLIAIGDLRHVLLSSIQAERLQLRYQLTYDDVQNTAEILAKIFNFRFDTPLVSENPSLQELKKEIERLPPSLGGYMAQLVTFLRTNPTLCPMLQRPHCLGNLLIVAAIFQQKKEHNEDLHTALYNGLNALAFAIGAGERAVLPCTSTPAGLLVRYANGVEISGEHKLETAKRDVAIAEVKVGYCGEVKVYDDILQDIAEADIIICAPGSLYSSIIPVLQTPGIADAVRNNKNALKMLVANIWVQEGETDLVSDKSDRRFYVSDLIEAYETNIPGGTTELFTEILSVSLQDIPASVLQRYAVEGKIPIYLDREKLIERGFIPVECDIYSTSLLQTRGVIQHDALNLAKVVRSLFVGRSFYRQVAKKESSIDPPKKAAANIITMIPPHQRFRQITARMKEIRFLGDPSHSSLPPKKLNKMLIDILWDNPVIPLAHLQYFSGVHLYPDCDWHREQKWDNVFSYFDPTDNTLKIRQEELTSRQNIELAFFVALGESLLGNYAQTKKIMPMIVGGKTLGQVYLLRLRPPKERKCYFSEEELHTFLSLSRMRQVEGKPDHYTRLLNTNEGFTPPGLLMGLIYAWYIDNRLATHIEYKMSLLKIARSALIPDQLHMAERRKKTISFFREVVFSGNR